MQNNGAFNVLSAANSIPSWNLGLLPSTSHSDSGGSAGMLPMASSSSGRQPLRDGELRGFHEEAGEFTQSFHGPTLRTIFSVICTPINRCITVRFHKREFLLFLRQTAP